MHDAHLVGHGGREVEAYEAVGDDGQEEHGGRDEHGEPEDGRRAHGLKGADVVPALAEYHVDVLAVQDEVEEEVNDERAPDAEVVEARPIGRIQAALFVLLLLLLLLLFKLQNSPILLLFDRQDNRVCYSPEN